jgi:O-antigen ligase
MREPQPIVDRRAWGALAVCLLLAGVLIWWQPLLAWFFGAGVVYLALRSFALVGAAKASMADPEARLAMDGEKAALPR